MTPALTAWLATTLTLGALAAYAVYNLSPHRGWAVAGFLVAGIVGYYTATLPLGHPTLSRPPAGKFTVLGARIDTPSATSAGAIYVLLDGEEPVYYKLPSSTADANDLQEAMDGAVQGEGGVVATVGEDGNAVFHPAPVVADEPKVGETAILGGGNG